MKTEELLDLDYRKEESKNLINEALKNIKVINKHSRADKVELEVIEKFVGIVCRKYNVMAMYLTPSYLDNNKENLYTLSFREKYGDKKWLGNVYGMCLYEVMAKAAIKLYAMVKENSVQKVGDNN